ncbi:IS66 family transposase [Enterococcus sp. DIV1420a]|uniref:IS66 family transposase n=1 Tax=Enterococcus sp. DIV1420a TaxID=2774672 RepID=UPI003F2091D5
MPEQLSGQMSLDLFDVPIAPPPLAEEIIVKTHQRKKGVKAQKLTDLPTKEVHHELPEEERLCDQYGTLMVDMGKKKVRDEIAFHQERIETLQHVQHSYCCKTCERSGETSLKKASVPKPPASKQLDSLALPSVVAETIRLKFKQKVPAYRQEEYWQQLGLAISRDNISNWHIRLGQDYLSLLVERFRQELMKSDVAFADETSYRVLESAKTNTYYWVFSNSIKQEHPVAIYHHRESRSKEIPQKFLASFQGYLHCDGYTGYDDFPNVLPVRCWAHVRRKFHEAMPKVQGETEHPAAFVLSSFKTCFKKEQEWKTLSPEERLMKRKEKLRPLLNQLFSYIETIPAVPKSKLDKAIQYMCKHRTAMERVFKDGRLELTNNQSERLVKELVMCRKNQLFSTSLSGAQTSGDILSVIKTAEQNGLESTKNLQYLFEELPNLPVLTAEHLDDYLPWAAKVQEKCK